MNSTKEFQVGKHGIAWLDSDFKKYIPETSFEPRAVGSFRKLERSMLDSEIESQLTPGTCELGDVLAFLDNAPQECKDGYANLFYLSGCVVYVHWYSGDSGWRVCAWQRGGDDWSADNRVFSPATGSLKALGSGSSDALSLHFQDYLSHLRCALFDIVEKNTEGLSAATVVHVLKKISEDMYGARVDEALAAIPVKGLDAIADAWDLTWLTLLAVELRAQQEKLNLNAVSL